MLVFVKETIGKNLTIKFLEAGLLKALFDKTYILIITWSKVTGPENP